MQRHTFSALNSTFIVDSEYQFVKELGQGAYGCVVAAKHRRTGEGCAIKKITNINTKVCTIIVGGGMARILACPAHYYVTASDDANDRLFLFSVSLLEDPYEEMFARDQVGGLFLSLSSLRKRF